MEIVGLRPLSLIDYPGKLACIIWVPGCNFRCPYCYNAHIVFNRKGKLHPVKEKDFFSFLRERQGLLDGVVITGGEPTLQEDLAAFARKIKKMDFLVKLDSNGSHPERLEELISQGLIDYIAMDIKAPLRRYEEVINVEIQTRKIHRSIELIKDQAPEYEFRTTVVPDLIDIHDITRISKLIGKVKYYIQQFEPEGKTINPAYMEKEPYSEEHLQKMCQEAEKYVSTCEVRGVKR